MMASLRVLPSKSTILTSIAVAFFASALYRMLNRLFRKPKEKKKTPKSLARDSVFFFTDQSPACYSSPSHNVKKCALVECPKRNMRAIKTHLLSATTSLDLCLYILTNEELAKCIIAVICKGVKVRVICDSHHVNGDGDFINDLRRCGAFVQMKTMEATSSPQYRVSELHMHHKFALIDDQLLLNGSMNWTSSAVAGNFENMVVTSDPNLIASFRKEFTRLWGNWETCDGFTENSGEGQSVTQFHEEVLKEEPVKLPDWKSLPEYHHVLFFSVKNLHCRPHMNSKVPCKKDFICSFVFYKYILDVLDSASGTLDVCLYLMTLEDIGDAIARAHKRGVKVRYICDAGMAAWSGSQIQSIVDAGIEVRMRKHNLFMHHKWLVIEKRMVLFGSLNWTMQGLCGNWENLVVTTQPDVVDCFNKHYEYLWGYLPSQEFVEWQSTSRIRRQ